MTQNYRTVQQQHRKTQNRGHILENVSYMVSFSLQKLRLEVEGIKSYK